MKQQTRLESGSISREARRGDDRAAKVRPIKRPYRLLLSPPPRVRSFRDTARTASCPTGHPFPFSSPSSTPTFFLFFFFRPSSLLGSAKARYL